MRPWNTADDRRLEMDVQDTPCQDEMHHDPEHEQHMGPQRCVVHGRCPRSTGTTGNPCGVEAHLSDVNCLRQSASTEHRNQKQVRVQFVIAFMH
jgi:hypothetical protein